MQPVRPLRLRREALTQLTDEQLGLVAGADATLLGLCDGGVTVLVHGCATDPRACHYVTDFC